MKIVSIDMTNTGITFRLLQIQSSYVNEMSVKMITE